MSPAARKIYLAVAMVTILIAAGTVGYIAIERMSFLDALYMTVITITTVGYEEVKPLDSAGRIFTIVLILTGVGSAFISARLWKPWSAANYAICSEGAP